MPLTFAKEMTFHARNIRLVIAIVLWCQSFSFVAGLEPAQPSDSLGYYENLGAITFILYCELYRKEEDPEMRTRIANEYWFSAFYYWHQVEHERIPKSQKVLRSITKTGHENFSPNDFAKHSDPLIWPKNAKKPKLVPAFGEISRNDYDRLRAQFHEWVVEQTGGEQGDSPKP